MDGTRLDRIPHAPALGAEWDGPDHSQLENYLPDLGKGDFTSRKFKRFLMMAKNIWLYFYPALRQVTFHNE